METVGILSLPTWHQTPPRNDLLESILQGRTHDTSPFPFSEEINKKLAFCPRGYIRAFLYSTRNLLENCVIRNGDISTLSCDAIVHTTNESFKEKSPITDKILQRAGPQLREDLAFRLKVCRTGDAKLSKGYNLPARHVIHTVGPKYNAKYHTAAESALFSCYQRVFQIVRENKFSTLGLCVINSIRRGYPPHEGAHLALRALRRFLEQNHAALTMVVLVVEELDYGIYELLLPLYFPRSEEEQEYAQHYLPADIGGPSGEPFIQERKIRIIDKPLLNGDEGKL
ncbi:GDAP2 [Cordylochernes scorpioides]|uniref:GDAP2 n=1 Tax=Cordylochernes scorpioides TaxID=51811 RepID=A0ABY6L7F0_9ARAC|nr:GDAP2 [Cordylochernes scorpioides]